MTLLYNFTHFEAVQGVDMHRQLGAGAQPVAMHA